MRSTENVLFCKTLGKHVQKKNAGGLQKLNRGLSLLVTYLDAESVNLRLHPDHVFKFLFFLYSRRCIPCTAQKTISKQLIKVEFSCLFFFNIH